LSFEAIEDGVLLSISYSQVKELYYQNPEFGFYLLRLIGARLLEGKNDLAIVKPGKMR
jgi:CRP-like cAMP-binding protein